MLKLVTCITVTGTTTTLCTKSAVGLPPSAASTTEVYAGREKLLDSYNASRSTHRVTKLLIDFFGQGSYSYDGDVLIEAALSHHL